MLISLSITCLKENNNSRLRYNRLKYINPQVDSYAFVYKIEHISIMTEPNFIILINLDSEPTSLLNSILKIPQKNGLKYKKNRSGPLQLKSIIIIRIKFQDFYHESLFQQKISI